MPGFKKCKLLISDEQQISRNPTNTGSRIQPIHKYVIRTEFLQLANLIQPSCSKSLTGGPGQTLMAVTAVISRKTNKELEQAFTALSLTPKNLLSPTVLELPTPCVKPNKQRLPLPLHTVMHITLDGLTSFHIIRKHSIYPEKHKQHIQGDVLKIILNLISNSQTNICVCKVKYHAGIAGNGCADAIAKYQANESSNSVADTGIPSAGPGENQFSQTSGEGFWCAKEEKGEHATDTSTAPAPASKVIYLLNLQNALTSNRSIPPYLFPRNFPKRSRLTSSRPDAILITPYNAKPTYSLFLLFLLLLLLTPYVTQQESAPVWDLANDPCGQSINKRARGGKNTWH
eukprot:1162143-Pelagomonas_calceolata.AAC.18